MRDTRIEMVTFDLNHCLQRRVSVDDVAQWLDVTAERVVELAEAAELPGRKLDGTWRFGVASLNLWMEGRSLEAAVVSVAHASVTAGAPGAPSFDLERLISLDELEMAYVRHVLSVENGSKTRAAEILGIDQATLYRKLKRF